MNLLTFKTQLAISKMKDTVFASSATKEGIVKCINEFYYSTTFTVNFETGAVSNKNGLVSNVKVIFHKGRYKFKTL